MKDSLRIGLAFVGLVVGGGFASGQEMMQFFTSFGLYSLFGILLATVGFAFLGMNLAQIGYRLSTTSHKEVVHFLSGRTIGTVFDIFITIFLFCITVAMFAGTASAFRQVLGFDPVIGSAFMVIITVLTLMLNIKSIINVIALAIPYLVGLMLIISVFSILTTDLSLAEQTIIAEQQRSAAPNWLMGALLYVSYNIASGVAMMTVIGSTATSKRKAGWGGIFGGLILGVLILLVNIALFAKIDVVAGKDMPIVEIAFNLHPILGILMSFALLAMIYSTSVGMMYSFIVRFISPKDKIYRPTVIFFGILGFLASFIGFTTLVGQVYSLMGYLGFAIIVAVLITWANKRN